MKFKKLNTVQVFGRGHAFGLKISKPSPGALENSFGSIQIPSSIKQFSIIWKISLGKRQIDSSVSGASRDSFLVYSVVAVRFDKPTPHFHESAHWVKFILPELNSRLLSEQMAFNPDFPCDYRVIFRFPHILVSLGNTGDAGKATPLSTCQDLELLQLIIPPYQRNIIYVNSFSFAVPR